MQGRFCRVCDDPVSVKRVRLWPNVVTCSADCSKENARILVREAAQSPAGKERAKAYARRYHARAYVPTSYQIECAVCGDLFNSCVARAKYCRPACKKEAARVRQLTTGAIHRARYRAEDPHYQRDYMRRHRAIQKEMLGDEVYAEQIAREDPEGLKKLLEDLQQIESGEWTEK